jgi:hypothetical protein
MSDSLLGYILAAFHAYFHCETPPQKVHSCGREFFQGTRREEAAASALSNEIMGNSLLLIKAKASHMSIVEEICPTCNGLFGSSSTN